MAALLSFSSVHTAATASTKVSMEALRSSIKGCPQTCLAFQWRPCCPQMHSRSLVCRAEENDRVEVARKMQMSSTDLLAQLMKAENTELFAREHAESLTQEFFMIASTYLSMAKKEGNAEVVNHLESTLKIAMQEREKILRPEIQLLNQLLRDLGASERAKTMDKFLDYLKSDSYFFQLLNRMILDVEKQPTSRNNPEQMKLLAQLRAINKEARDVSKGLKHAARDKK